MKRGYTRVAVGIGLIATLLAPTMAQAQRRGDWYQDVRPYLGRRGGENIREARAWEQVVDLRGAVRRLDRRGDITARQSDRFYDRIDRVAKFLREDRRLSDKEFDRRQDDLRDISRDLHEAARSRANYRNERYDRSDRRDNRRYDDRTDRRYERSASICDVCNGVCRYR